MLSHENESAENLQVLGETVRKKTRKVGLRQIGRLKGG